MRDYLKAYIKEIEANLKKEKEFSKDDLEKFKTKIMFFQHERLIHLLVTLFYSLFALIFMILGIISLYFLIIFGIISF